MFPFIRFLLKIRFSFSFVHVYLLWVDEGWTHIPYPWSSFFMDDALTISVKSATTLLLSLFQILISYTLFFISCNNFKWFELGLMYFLFIINFWLVFYSSKLFLFITFLFHSIIVWIHNGFVFLAPIPNGQTTNTSVPFKYKTFKGNFLNKNTNK